jgi:hypothetical protein
MRERRLASAPGALLLFCVLAAAVAGCKKKKPEGKPPPVASAVVGLDAVPGESRAVVSANVAALRTSWLVDRAVAQMLRRDPGLKERIDELVRACKFDPARDLDSFLIGIGGRAPGRETEEAVMVVSGAFQEAELASCVGQSAATQGTSFTSQRADGRTFYRVGERSGRQDSVWFTVSGPRTVVIATSSEWLARALSPGKSVRDVPAMAALLEKVDQTAGIWAIGQVDEQVGAGLVELAGGAVKTPPRAMFGHGRLARGIELELGVMMASEQEANSLVSLMKGQLSLGALAAQRYGLGTLIQKLGVDSEAETVYLRLALSEDEVRRVLSQIDTPTGSTQNSAEN